jgi:hypothetical protein
MRPVSAAFLAAVASSNQMVTTVDVVQGATLIASLPTPVDGTVTLDDTAQIRGRVELAVADDGTLGLVPTTPASLLAPYGNELRVRRGVEYASGVRELVSLGVFRIEGVDVDDTPGGLSIRVTGQDYSSKVLDAQFEDPFTVAAGTNVATALDTVLAGAGITAGAATSIVTAQTTPTLVAEEGGDRLAFAVSLAASIGLRMYFDGDGVIRFTPIVTSGAPAVQLVEGDSGVLVQAGRSWDRTGTHNRWIVTGENTGETAPVRGVATDDNLASPTYYGGPFGRAPTFISSSFLTTNAQALDMANALKALELGTTQRVRFGAYVNPALEPGDIARITRLAAGIDEDHIIESLTIPLIADATLTGTTRAKSVT